MADEDVTSANEYRRYIAQGTSWVAPVDGLPGGFLVAEKIGTDLHILEVAVGFEHQKQGIGRALFSTVFAKAPAIDVLHLTLTTFRDLDFNEGFYASLGFRRLKDDETPRYLLEELARQAAEGLPRERRCAMILGLTETPSRSG